jgi:16S rRNA processing protein RimM
MKDKRQMILMGAIAGVHGVRGEVKVKSFTGDPLAIAAYGPLYDESGRRFDLKLSSKAAKDAIVIAKIDGIADRNAAEALKGKRLYAPREALPALEDETEFYANDLIGLGVEDRNGKPGLRPHYHPNYYGAFAFDLDGNKIEACSHHPEP